MGRASGIIGRCGAAPLLAILIALGPAHADVTTERGSSIITFPKVISDHDGYQTRGFPVETIIQISNISNSLAFAHCFYVNAAPLDPTQPPSFFNPPQWQEIDFDIILTKQQPTHWVVGTGRRFDPTDRQCNRGDPPRMVPPFTECNGAGFDPGLIPPLPPNFVGFLTCIEVDSSGAPLNGNRLKGEATLLTPRAATTAEGTIRRGDVSKYNAIGIQGLNTDTNSNNGDFNLCIGGGIREGCPSGAEYNACPETVILNHFAERSTQPAIELLAGDSSIVHTELTLMPCTQDFENQIPGQVVVQFLVFNEFEERLSASTTVTCWANFRLRDAAAVFDVTRVQTRFAQTRMTPGEFTNGEKSLGFIGVAEEFQGDSSTSITNFTRAALNLHIEGEWAFGDLITLPEVEP